MKRKRNDVYTATLYLSDIEDFFAKPDMSPFSRDYQEHSHTSGIEYLAKELYARPAAREVRVDVILPASHIRPGLEEETRAALRRYCGGRVKEIEQDLRGLRQHALRALLAALVGVVVFIGLGSELAYSGTFLLRLLGQGLIVLGWVFVWFPLDALFFGAQYFQRDPRVYKKLMSMQLVLKSAGESLDSAARPGS